MTIQFLKTFSSSFLENEDFVAFEVFEHRCGNRSTGNGRRTNFDVAVIFNQQYAVKLHLRTLFSLKALNIDLAVFFNLELLPGYLYNCIHYFICFFVCS